MPKGNDRGTFVVQVMNNQHATWQGTVNWVEGKKTVPFRSSLELIKLLDSAVEATFADGNGEDEDADDDVTAELLAEKQPV